MNTFCAVLSLASSSRTNQQKLPLCTRWTRFFYLLFLFHFFFLILLLRVQKKLNKNNNIGRKKSSWIQEKGRKQERRESASKEPENAKYLTDALGWRTSVIGSIPRHTPARSCVMCTNISGHVKRCVECSSCSRMHPRFKALPRDVCSSH